MSDFSQNANFSRNERRRLLTMYMDQYNQANSQIDRLYDTLDEIRSNINTLIGNNNTNNYNNNNNNNYNTNTNNTNNYNNYNRNNNMNRNRRNNTFNQTTGFSFNNSFRNRSGRGPYIYYDYNNPINPSTYLDNTTNNDERELTNLITSFLNSTVVIRPTEEQINNASRLVRYSQIPNPNSATCAISLDPFVASDMVRQIHHCGHIFFPEQFAQWFRSNVRCPVCRHDIRNYRSTVSSENTVPNNSPLPPQIPLRVDEEKETEPENDIDRNFFSNFNTVRNPVTNDIEHVTFDISGNEIVDNLLSSITDRFVTGLFSPISTNSINSANNDRFVYDPSNNILLYETIIRRDNN
jgi:hypothetical protein